MVPSIPALGAESFRSPLSSWRLSSVDSSAVSVGDQVHFLWTTTFSPLHELWWPWFCHSQKSGNTRRIISSQGNSMEFLCFPFQKKCSVWNSFVGIIQMAWCNVLIMPCPTAGILLQNIYVWLGPRDYEAHIYGGVTCSDITRTTPWFPLKCVQLLTDGYYGTRKEEIRCSAALRGQQMAPAGRYQLSFNFLVYPLLSFSRLPLNWSLSRFTAGCGYLILFSVWIWKKY